MAPTDTSEKGLESLIVRHLTGHRDLPGGGEMRGGDELPYEAEFQEGAPSDYDRDYALDVPKLLAFLTKTQPEVVAAMGIAEPGHTRSQFLGRLQGEITKNGTIHVLTKGIKNGPHQVDLFYGSPTPENLQATVRFAENIFSVTRQVHYSKANENSLDVVFFINGLPLITFELKNQLTKQNVNDAVDQYKRDRDHRELLFYPGRCAVHFAVDDQLVRFCTELKGKSSYFLPFDKGHNQGAGNPPNLAGLKTAYLWEEVLTRASLTNIIENYAGQFDGPGANGGKKQKQNLWPRYHQLDVVRRLLADVETNGVGTRYLIQHSAGSGKSNSIAWLAHQLVSVRHQNQTAFDSVIVVTDRTVLDDQLSRNIRRFTSVAATFGRAESSSDLRDHLALGRKIIATTVQKFPFVLKGMAEDHTGKRFAIIIDEAHSSQGGRAASTMHAVLKGDATDADPDDYEDLINKAITDRKMLTNASYFAFTATPKNRTLELFGTPVKNDSGATGHLPFHVYSMKQAIEERFILDVLANYTPWNSYYRLVKAIEDDPEFDVARARKRLKSYVEGHESAIRIKAEIIVNHFNDHIYKPKKLKGDARAMVCCKSIKAAITYYRAIQTVIAEQKLAFKPIVAFSGEYELDGTNVTESSVNGFPSSKIPEMVKTDPYRILVVADKFLTGYDEPLLHTMYVDKPLAGIKAVQSLSRLNRTADHLAKTDTFVLDFFNDPDAIRESFQPFYQTTVLSQETDPNKLHDLQADLDGYQVYEEAEIDTLVGQYLANAPVEHLHPILDLCVERYKALDEDGQVEFKGKAKAFVRTYNFLGAILPYPYPDWEKRSIFLNFLIPKLPAPVDLDPTRGILETVDMESYRVEAGATMQLGLSAEDGLVDPAVVGIGGKPEPEIDFLSSIVKSFNETWGNIEWTDGDKIARLIAQELPAAVAQDQAYQNAIANSDRENARIEHDKAMQRAIHNLLAVDSELYKHFLDNPAFKKYVQDVSFDRTYTKPT